MKKLLFFITLIFSLTSSAQAFNFTLNGSTYSFSTVSTFSANQALLSSQVWWNDSTLTGTFVNALNTQAPDNTGFAHNYTVDAGWSGGGYVNSWSNSYCCGPQSGNADSVTNADNFNWAVVRLLASTAETQRSLALMAQKMRGVFNGAAIGSNYANMNTYDCNLFDEKGMCVSTGGRYTVTDSSGSENTSAVVVLGYRATPTIRVGGFLDKSLNNNAPTGISISNKNPLLGMFIVWNQQVDALGYQFKLANAYQSSGVTTARDVAGTSEVGRGNTTLTTESYVGEASYAFNYGANTLLRPYIAMRYTEIEQDAYTETSASLPLSYGAIRDRSTTALMGVKMQHRLTPEITLTSSLGLEHDLSHKVDRLTATGVSGITSENFSNEIDKTRPIAAIGMMYALSRTQRLSADLFYQQLPFQSTGSTTLYFNYMIGL